MEGCAETNMTYTRDGEPEVRVDEDPPTAVAQRGSTCNAISTFPTPHTTHA